MESQSTTGQTAGTSASTTTFLGGARDDTTGQVEDLDALVVDILTPADGAVIPDALNATESIVFSGTATSDPFDPISLIEVSINDGASWIPATVSGDDWTYTFAGLTDGTYDLLARATTPIRTASESVTVRVNRRPEVLTASVTHQDVVPPNEALTIDWTGIDTDGVIQDWRIVLQRRTNEVERYNFVTEEFELAGLDLSVHSIFVADNNGGIGYALPVLGDAQEYRIFARPRDNDLQLGPSVVGTPSDFTFFTEPVPPAVDFDGRDATRQRGSSIQGEASDFNGVQSVEWRQGDGPWRPVDTDNSPGDNTFDWSITPAYAPQFVNSDFSIQPLPPITIGLRATDVDGAETIAEPYTFQPVVPVAEIVLEDDRNMTGVLVGEGRARTVRIRILRNAIEDGSPVDEMWDGSAWVPDDETWQLVSGAALNPGDSWGYPSPPTLAESNSLMVPPLKDDYEIIVEAHTATGFTGDSSIPDTDWPVRQSFSPAQLFEFDPLAIGDTIPITVDYSGEGIDTGRTDHEWVVRRWPTHQPRQAPHIESLDTDGSWNSTTITIPVQIPASEVFEFDAPVEQGYTYEWYFRQAYDTHGNATSQRSDSIRQFSVESLPIAFTDTVRASQDQQSDLVPLMNDLNLFPDVELVIRQQPEFGVAVVAGTGDNSTILYTPNIGYTGPDSLLYDVNNDDGGTDTGLVNIIVGATPNEIENSLRETSTRVLRRIDILNDDGSIYLTDVEVEANGEVTISYGSGQRRSSSITFCDEDGTHLDPDEVWYDKIIQMRRGFHVPGIGPYLPVIFTGRIANSDRNHFESRYRTTLTDMSKDISYEFGVHEEYPANQPIEVIIEQIALAGGLSPDRVRLPITGTNTEEILIYEPTSNRWESARRLAETYEWDLYFDAGGVMVMNPFPREADTQFAHEFTIGIDGNIGTNNQQRNDAEVFNVLYVVGESSEGEESFVGVARRFDGPTGINTLGERPKVITRSEVTSNDHAQSLAELLLEMYVRETITISSNVIPDPRWEVNRIVRFESIIPGDDLETDRYILTQARIPWGVGPASINVGRMNT